MQLDEPPDSEASDSDAEDSAPEESNSDSDEDDLLLTDSDDDGKQRSDASQDSLKDRQDSMPAETSGRLNVTPGVHCSCVLVCECQAYAA